MPIYKMNGKKNGQQKYRVRINYNDSAGNHRQITRIAYGNAEARNLEATLLKQVKETPATSRMTMQELYNEYTAAKKHEVRETSLLKTKNRLEHHVLPYCRNMQLEKIDAAMLTKWKNTLSESKLAVSTRRGIFGEFRAMLNFAVRTGRLSRNPLSLVGNFKNAYEINHQERLQYYTPDEFKKYIACARKSASTITEWGYFVFFAIAYFTGARKGEINALKWSDIDGDFLHIRRSITQKLKGGDKETPPKNKTSYRSLQMPLPLIRILAEHKERQKEIKYFTEDFRICGGPNCLRDTSIDQANRRFAKAAGLPRIKIHDFRHSHASFLANEGINIQEIARRLGHSKIEITWNTYAHLYPREEERAVKVLNTVI